MNETNESHLIGYEGQRRDVTNGDDAGKEYTTARMRPAEKYVILVGDGMGDYPLEELGGKTPLEVARTPAMDRLARLGELGRVQTIPINFPPGSDVANLSLMGYNPAEYYTGRGPMEATAMGIKMNPEDVAFRCNLVTLSFREGRVYMKDYSAGHITTEESHAIIHDLAAIIPTRSFALYPGVSYRNLLMWRGGPEGIATVPPHDYTGKDVTESWHVYEEEPLLYNVLTKAIAFLHRHPVNERRRAEGKLPANSLWPWGQGRRPTTPTIYERFGINGAVVAAVDLIKGAGIWAGMEIINVPGATGYIDTNYAGKAAAALNALKEKDLVFLHLEAPDEAGHMGDVREKIRAIERFDKEIVGPVMDELKEFGHSYRVMVVTDHYTPIKLKTHTAEPVPFAIFDSLDPKDNSSAAFNEKTAAMSPIFIKKGHTLLERFIGIEPMT
ncbi:MAG: cofactor-independent phosphoglycerate mutase [Dissulfurimicrobium sp.]|uniref:cofactor-independent phosphoglycerate mutase n=1 Tax=Dissulfurimicrobium sp. TaxID=2022436 RepID=UPI003D11584B